MEMLHIAIFLGLVTFVPGQVNGKFTRLKDKCLKKVNAKPLFVFISLFLLEFYTEGKTTDHLCPHTFFYSTKGYSVDFFHLFQLASLCSK